VVLGVAPATLARVVEHLLRPRVGFTIVEKLDDASGLVPAASRQRPHTVVTNLRFLGRGPALRIAELRSAVPAARLVLIAPEGRLGEALGYGADTCLNEGDLVAELLSVLQEGVPRANGPPD